MVRDTGRLRISSDMIFNIDDDILKFDVNLKFDVILKFWLALALQPLPMRHGWDGKHVRVSVSGMPSLSRRPE
jgi:hypothetical protein